MFDMAKPVFGVMHQSASGKRITTSRSETMTDCTAAQKAYADAKAPARKAYDDAVAAAQKAYDDAVAPARKAYADAVNAAEALAKAIKGNPNARYDMTTEAWLAGRDLDEFLNDDDWSNEYDDGNKYDDDEYDPDDPEQRGYDDAKDGLE
jgi:hypothetical protein